MTPTIQRRVSTLWFVLSTRLVAFDFDSFYDQNDSKSVI